MQSFTPLFITVSLLPDANVSACESVLLLWRDTVGGHQPCFYCPVVGPYLQGYSVDCSTVEEKSNFIAGDWLLKKKHRLVSF